MDTPVLRFDSFGSVSYVLRDVEINVPAIFTDDPEQLVESVRNTVNNYAARNSWETIALSLSQGLARYDLNDIVEKEVRHHGPIVIDPTGSTPEYQEFHHCSEVKSCRERLIMANERSGDVMLILYGIEQVDRNMTVNLLMGRLRMLETGLNLLAENDVDSFLAEKEKNRTPSVWHKIALMIRQLNIILQDGVSEQETTNAFDQLGNRINFLIFPVYAYLLNLENEVLSPEVSQTLNSMLISVGSIPKDFSSLGVNFEQYYNAVNDLKNRVPSLMPSLDVTSGVNLDHKHEAAPTLEPN